MDLRREREEDVQNSAAKLKTAVATVVSWYHGGINRNISEAILLANGVEGTYLLRDSEHNKGSFVLSTRSSDAVQHYEVKVCNGGIEFGTAHFNTLDEFLLHFDNLPVIANASGISLTLKHPYPKYVPEPAQYVDIKRHAECGHVDLLPGKDRHIASKEGYLTKLGAIHKNWKLRWFVLMKSELRYYKRRGVDHPIKVLDLQRAVEVTEDSSMGKSWCFRLVFPERTFYLVATSTDDMRDWIAMINWKLDHFKGLTGNPS